MFDVSDDFLAALTGSHAAVSRVKLLDTVGATGNDPAGTVLDLIDGAVTLDAKAKIRGTLDVTVAAKWPRTASTDDLVPYGTELHVSRGVDLGNGTIERIPLGIYRVTSVEQSDAPDGPLRITGQDRMSLVLDGKLELPAKYTTSNSYGFVVNALIQAIFPYTVTIEWSNTTLRDTNLGRAVIAEEDRYEFLDKLVRSIGQEWHFNYEGKLVVLPAPSTTTSVWTVNAGNSGVLVNASRSRTRDGVFNVVVAKGQALDSATPAYGVARDTGVNSVTRYDGAFGQVTRFFGSPLLTTDVAALAAATTELAKTVGVPYSVEFDSIVNPALEPLDPITLTYPPERGVHPTVVSETHVVDRMVVPLHPGGAMACGTRLTSQELTT